MAKFIYKKKFGQNFLQDEKTIDSIVASITPNEKDLIIEIGPGAGALTKKLKTYNAQLIAFEIDEETKKYLLPLQDDKTKIIYADFLNIDLQEFLKDYEYDKLYFIGNLPYYITTPIIEHIIDSHIEHDSLTVMLQAEVSSRLLATPGHREYGYMTVLLNYHYKPEKVIDVDRTKFYPIPNVDSAVIKLSAKETKEVDYKAFKELLKQAFQYKRKNICNNLKNYDRIQLENVLSRHGKKLTDRAEEIDLDTFIDLSRNLSKTPRIEESH